jgi:putative cell wall-binding protein
VGRTRRTGAAIGVVLWALLAVPLPPAGAASSPFVHTVAPAPGAITGTGETVVRATVAGARGLSAVRLTVDDVAVAAVEVGQPDAGGDISVAGSVRVGAGEHVARLEIEDSTGGRAERSWSFLATDRSTNRVAGVDRFGTAVAVSAAAFPTEAAAAVLARGDEFADALAGAPLAVAVGGPLLLATREALPAATAAELRRVLAPGARVHLLGGEAALGEGVARAVEALGLRVVRHAGVDRFATAAAVARALPPSLRALVASGASFPDALAASAPAARDGLPVLLTAGEQLPEATARVLVERDVEAVTIVGGSAAVSEAVEQDVAARVERVQRVAGADRYATAVAVRRAFFERPSGVSLASGEGFADALAGSVLAAARDAPLLLTAPRGLSPATAEALRSDRPEAITVYGGTAAVAEHVQGTARRAAVDGADPPRVTGTGPAAAATVPYLDAVTVTLARPVDPRQSSVYLELAGRELFARIAQTEPTTTLTVPVAPALPVGATYDGRVVVAATGVDGAVAHEDVAFTYAPPDPVFATVETVSLHLPSRVVELVGFHQSSHDGARQLDVRDTATPTLTLPSRGRGTGSRTAADVVAAPDQPVLAPVTGRVRRAGSYALYCDHTDHYLVIEPDARPGWEVKVLHFEGLQVSAGDHVTAFSTVVGTAPRALPFRSQADDYSQDRNWPHVHIEVVDPSIPDRPGRGC